MGLERFVGKLVKTKESIPSDRRGAMISAGVTLFVQEMVGNQHFNLAWLNGKRAANQIHYSKLVTGEVMKQLRIKVTGETPRHVYFIIFMNGVNCGNLCMLRSEAFVFINALKLGADAGDLLMEIRNDESELFSDCGTPGGSINPKDAEIH
jgi:hypothetical protein